MRARDAQAGRRRAVPGRRAALPAAARCRRRASELRLDDASHPLRVVDDDEACADGDGRWSSRGVDVTLRASFTCDGAPGARAARRNRTVARSAARARSSRRCPCAAAQGSHQSSTHFHDGRPRSIILAGACAAGEAAGAEPAARAALRSAGTSRRARAAPENTLAGFAFALELGVTTLELDCGVTRDGVVVVSHDRAAESRPSRATPTAPGSTRPGRRSRPHLRGAAALRRRTAPARHEYARALSGAAGGRRRAHPATRRRVRAGASARRRDVRFNIETKISPPTPAQTAAPEPSRARSVAGDPRRRHGVARDDPVVRLAHARDRAAHRAGDRDRRADRSATGRRHHRDRPAGPSPWLGGLDVDDFGGSVPKLVHGAGRASWSPHYRDLTPRSSPKRTRSVSRSSRGPSTSRPRWRACSSSASTA